MILYCIIIMQCYVFLSMITQILIITQAVLAISPLRARMACACLTCFYDTPPAADHVARI